MTTTPGGSYPDESHYSNPADPNPLPMGNGADGKTGEPVAIAQIINAVVIVGAAFGWSFLNSTVINAVITIIGAAVVIGTTIKARSNVKTLV